MDILAITTNTSRHNNQYNGNLKNLFQSIVKDKDNCNIIVDIAGVEQAINVVNGKVTSKLLELSVINLLTRVLGNVKFHTNPS